jgi:hypothetical protein
MQLIVIVHRNGNEEPVVLHVPDDCDAPTLKQMIAIELGIPPHNQLLEFNDSQLRNGYLSDHGILDGSLIVLKEGQESVQPNRQMTIADIPPNVLTLSELYY